MTSDVQLAAALGIERSTVAQWKRRGGLPAKYRTLLEVDEQREEWEKTLNAWRHHLLGRAENHYFLRAALAFMASELPAPEGAGLALLGSIREYRLLKLMNLAKVATAKYLAKRYCESNQDYIALIAVMKAHEEDAIRAVLAEPSFTFREGPQ